MASGLGDLGKNSLNSELAAACHDALVVNAVHFSHVHVSIDEVERVHDAEAKSYALHDIVDCVVRSLSPPVHQLALAEPWIAPLQDMEGDVVQVVIGEVDFIGRQSPQIQNNSSFYTFGLVIFLKILLAHFVVFVSDCRKVVLLHFVLR